MKFEINNISTSQKNKMIEKGVWNIAAPLKIEQLVNIIITHYDFEGNLKEGSIVVAQKLAEITILIFKEILAIKFPIQSIIPIEHFEGDDEKSMEANNSSCFNCRNIAGSNLLSLHSYGMAIDINPLQNPYIMFENNETKIFPTMGYQFLNRTNIRAGMVENIRGIFEKYGFDWGGKWDDPVDYHHFQIPRDKINNYL